MTSSTLDFRSTQTFWDLTDLHAEMSSANYAASAPSGKKAETVAGWPAKGTKTFEASLALALKEVDKDSFDAIAAEIGSKARPQVGAALNKTTDREKIKKFANHCDTEKMVTTNASGQFILALGFVKELLAFLGHTTIKKFVLDADLVEKLRVIGRAAVPADRDGVPVLTDEEIAMVLARHQARGRPNDMAPAQADLAGLMHA